MKEFTGAAIITVAYDAKQQGTTREERVKCVVPASWLWSPDGLAEAFIRLRAGLLPKPAEGVEDEPWESFHIAEAVEDTEFLVEGENEVES
ncbi:MAG TPA: hypothetical protein VFA33_06150 [Bryobacteraceae bacterium]|nr:hypothetical protein [Bryobacteraceae bacterium]